MKVSKKERRIIGNALDEWQSQGVLTQEEHDKLTSTFEVSAFDWTQIARYSFTIAVTCVVLATLSFVFDEWLIELFKSIFTAPELAKSLFFLAGAVGFYVFGIRRKKLYPSKVLANEALFVLGMISTALSIFFLGKVIETENLAPLILLASAIYGLIGLWLPSQTVWIFALMTLGAWFGFHSYQVQSDGYYLGMNYPLRFALFGGLLLVASLYVLPRIKAAMEFESVTKFVGLLYFFFSLWLLSIFGNHADFSIWLDIEQISILYWSVLLLVVSLAALYLGLKHHDDMTKGVALVFIFLNLYSRFFEYLWEGMHKALFFAILAVSFWLLGTKAEKIYQLKLPKA